MRMHVLLGLIVCLVALGGCSEPARPTPERDSLPTQVRITSTPEPATGLSVQLLYPRADTEVTMGQPARFIAHVADAQGNAVSDARVTITLHDARGQVVATVPAGSGGEGVYRGTWPVPNRTAEGTVSLSLAASEGDRRGEASGTFKIKNSTSEILLAKYGFWLDPPALGKVTPALFGEEGDAHNGMIRWGGMVPAQHVLPEAWVDVQWRTGDYGLKDAEAVRRFMLGQLPDLGFDPIREIGPFRPVKFKQWDAWQVGGRGEVAQDQVEWLVFYAPEVDKTFVLGTIVVLPPAGIDPHARLRDSFAISADAHPAGVAPEPLPQLLPRPELLSPELGARFQGLGQPIVLRWKPLKELAPDEYYEVVVDYNYDEGNPSITMTTRDTQVTLPEKLYRAPNCHVFNWQVTLKRETGRDENGQPQGKPISYSSLHWYVRWLYPAGEAEPFVSACPNAQY